MQPATQIMAMRICRWRSIGAQIWCKFQPCRSVGDVLMAGGGEDIEIKRETISDAELAERLRETMRLAVDASSIRQRLEKDLAIDLSNRTDFIRDHVSLFTYDLLKQNNRWEEEEGWTSPDEEDRQGEGENVDEEDQKKRTERSQRSRALLLAVLNNKELPEPIDKVFSDMKDKANQYFDFIEYLIKEFDLSKHDSNPDEILEEVGTEMRRTRFDLLDDQIMQDAIQAHILRLKSEREIHLNYEYKLYLIEHCSVTEPCNNAFEIYERLKNEESAKYFFENLDRSKLLYRIEDICYYKPTNKNDYIEAALIEKERSLIELYISEIVPQLCLTNPVYDYLYKTRRKFYIKRSIKEELRYITDHFWACKIWDNLMDAMDDHGAEGAPDHVRAVNAQEDGINGPRLFGASWKHVV